MTNHDCARHRGKDPASPRMPGMSASTAHRPPSRIHAGIPLAPQGRMLPARRGCRSGGTRAGPPERSGISLGTLGGVSPRERRGPRGGDRPHSPPAVSAVSARTQCPLCISRTPCLHSPLALSGRTHLPHSMPGSPVPHSPLSVSPLRVPSLSLSPPLSRC